MAGCNRRLFLSATLGSLGLVAGCSAGDTRKRPFGVEETSIDLIQRAMVDGELTARSLCERYLERIALLDPKLNGIIETNPEALSNADALDRERQTRNARSALHGVPIVVKDNIETADRMQTTAGSRALQGVPVVRDAFVIARLRAAGVVILGKANLTEWAGIGGRNGYSTRGGQTANPYDLARTPLGSSSGSAVAVTANLAAAALGTETMGSILGPSSLLGVVGVKPTVGLIGRSGVIPVALSMDSVGPITRTVQDAAHMLNILAGPDPDDTLANRPAPQDYVRALIPDLAGLRIGIVREPSAGAASNALFDGVLVKFRELGATLVGDVELPEVTESWFADHLEVMLTELKEQFPQYIAARRPKASVRTLADIIASNIRDGVPQGLLEMAQQKGTLSGEAYRKAFARIRRTARDDGIDQVILRHRLDALISPSVGPAWTLAEEKTLDVFLPRGILLASDAGYPAITVPMGQVNGLPVGLLMFGPAWSEGVLLRCAHAYEQATHHRTPPALKG